MIVETEKVEQRIDVDRTARFEKQVIHTQGSHPVVMVRKRLLDPTGSPSPTRAAVLLCHGFGQNRYAWHLPQRSFSNHLAASGFDVFNLDLRGHGRSAELHHRRSLSVDDYIHQDLPAALREVAVHSGREKTFLLGHSLGGLVSMTVAALDPAPVAGIVTIGVPYRFTRGSLALAWIANAVRFVAASGGGPRGTARLPVMAIGKAMRATRPMWEAKWLPLPIRAWEPGALEPDTLEDFLRLSFDRATFGDLNQLARLARTGRWKSADGREDYTARIESLDLPLLVVAGTADLLAPPASVRPAYERSRSSDRAYHEVVLGHGDLLIGREAPRLVWPAVTDWLRDHSEN